MSPPSQIVEKSSTFDNGKYPIVRIIAENPTMLHLPSKFHNIIMKNSYMVLSIRYSKCWLRGAKKRIRMFYIYI